MMFHAPIVPRARRRPSDGGTPRREDARFKDVRLYLVERKMGLSRRRFLTQLARSKGFIVDEHLSDDVTHVVSEETEASSLRSWLKGRDLRSPSAAQVLHITWFTDSMRAGSPVAVETRHLIQEPSGTTMEATKFTQGVTVSEYACQRRTSLENLNEIFTDAFEVLAESYEFNEMEGACLAFRRAASVLKSLPQALRCMGATEGLPCLGEQTQAVMQEILQYGRSLKVESILTNERYQTLKLFTSVFGVGPKTADKWHRRGLRSFADIHAEPTVQLNRMQQSGFLYYGDISRAVSKAEARALGRVIDEAVRMITSSGRVSLTGGFRRGKEFGHDVDFILTTAEEGKERTLIPGVIHELDKQGILLFCDYHDSTLDASQLPCHRFEAMDLFAKCFVILRLDGSLVEGGLDGSKGDDRGWRAVRVDLVCPPIDRYAFALLGWTGSRQFARDLRRFARKERKMLLDNHGLYDKTKIRFLAAGDESDIFAHLGLEYIEPWQRNA